MILKSNIRSLVEGSGYKRSFIADKLGVSVKQLRNYESGHSLIPMDKGYILAELLDVKVDDLYERSVADNVPDRRRKSATSRGFSSEEKET